MASMEDESFHEINTHFAKNLVQPEWVPLSLTLVEYPQGDLFGKFLAFISLMPFAIIAGFMTLILFRRDLHTIAFLGGVIINDCINFILKHVIREPRPMRRENVNVEYGMPSTHAQFMWFFTAYAILFVCIRFHHSNNCTISEKFWRSAIAAGCVVVAFLVCCSGVYLLYHTKSQVFCGALIGIALGIVWFFITHVLLTPVFPIIVSWRISEYMLLRDTTLIPNILWFEYTNVRSEARARSRRLVSMKSR